jgi:hypothetical protein
MKQGDIIKLKQAILPIYSSVPYQINEEFMITEDSAPTGYIVVRLRTNVRYSGLSEKDMNYYFGFNVHIEIKL